MCKSANPAIDEAFETLLEEIEIEVALMDQISGQSLKSHEYADARALANHASMLIGFRDELRGLKKKWVQFSGWVRQVEQKAGLKPDGRTKHQSHREPRTPVETYYQTILELIHQDDGAISTAKLAAKVRDAMEDNLGQDEEEELLPGSGLPRWRNALNWALQDMVQDGLLNRDVGPNEWEPTECGQWFRIYPEMAESR